MNAQHPSRPLPRDAMTREALRDWLLPYTRLQRRHIDAILLKFERSHPGAASLYAAAPLPGDRAGDQSEGFEISARPASAPESPAQPVLFVKVLNDARYHEAWHYMSLHHAHAPVPALHGWMSNVDGREVLFIEHVRTDLSDDSLPPESTEYETFIGLIGRYNALTPPTRYTSQLPKADISGILQDTLPAMKALDLNGRRGALGSGISRFLDHPDHTRARLLAQLDALAAAVRAMPVGLIHGDLFPRHVGVRRLTGEWLLFDLLYTQTGPRLFDLAPFLGAPDDASRLTRARRRHLAEVYREHCSAPFDSTDALLSEAATLWLAWEFRNLRRWVLSALEEGHNGAATDSRRWLLRRMEQFMAWKRLGS